MQPKNLAIERMARVGRALEGVPYSAKVDLVYLTRWKMLLINEEVWRLLILSSNVAVQVFLARLHVHKRQNPCSKRSDVD